MSRFIETICWKNGRYQNLDLHQARVNATFNAHYPLAKPLQLREILPVTQKEIWVKARLSYDEVAFTMQSESYSPKHLQSLQVVVDNDIDYTYKYEDRAVINGHVALGARDDIIIVKNNKVTDASYANLVFWTGQKWITPDSYLLNGVRRQQLLRDGLIEAATITIHDLPQFEQVSLINAMLEPGMVATSTSQIF